MQLTTSRRKEQRMNNTGSLNAIIGADMSSYEKAMNSVEKMTRDAFRNADRAAQMGGQNMVRTIQTMMSSIVKTSNSDVNRIIERIVSSFNNAGSLVQRTVAGIGEKLPDPFRRGFTRILDIGQNSMSRLAKFVSSSSLSMSYEMNRFAEKMPNSIGKAIEFISKKIRRLGTDTAGELSKTSSAFFNTSRSIQNVASNTADKILGTLNGKIFNPFITGVKGMSSAFGNAFRGIGSIINQYLVQPIINLGRKVVDIAKIIGNAFLVPFKLIYRDVSRLAVFIGSKLLSAIQSIGNALVKVGKAIHTYVLSPLIEVGKVAVRIGIEMGQAIIRGIQAVGRGINNYIIQPLWKVIKVAANIGKQIGLTIIDGLKIVATGINQFIIQPLLRIVQVTYNIGRQIVTTIGNAIVSVGRFINTHFIQPLVSIGRFVARIGIEIGTYLLQPIFAIGRGINTHIIQPIRRMGQEFAQVGRTLFSQLGGPIRSIGTAFGNAFTMVGQGFMRLPRFATNAVNSISKRLNPLVRTAGNVSNRMVDSFSRGFNNMNRTASGVLNRISEKFAKGSNGANGFRNSIMQLASAFSLAGLASRALNAIVGSFDDAISRYDSLNQFPRIMQMWGYSAEDAERSSNKLQKGIDGLPTKLDDITSNVQRLTTITGDLDKSTDAAIALNNAFLASGSSSADASRGLEQYSQMLATGTVDLQSWRTLQETMPGALMQTAEAFGYTGQSATTDFYSALSDGEITFDQFQNKLIELNDGVGGFAEQAREATVGIATSLQNLRTAVSRNLEGIIRKFDEVIQSRGLPQLAIMIDNGKEAINELGQAVQDVIPTIVDGFMRLSGFDLVAMLAIPKLLGIVGLLSTKLFGVSTIGFKMAGGLQSAFGKVAGSLSGLGNVIGGFGGLMASSASIGVNALGGMVSAITSIASVALSAIGPTAILGLIVVGLGLLNKTFGTEINNMLNTVTEKAPEVIGKFVRGISEKLPDLILAGTAMITQLSNTIVTLLPMIFDAGMFALESLVRGISAQFPTLINSSLQIITALASGILDALPRLVLMGMQIILSLVNGINANLESIVQSVQVILMSFVNSFVTNLPMIIETGIQILLGLVSGLTTMLPQLLVVGFNALITLIQGITENIPLLLNGAVMIVQSLVSFIAQNLPAIISMGMQVVFALISGVFENLPAIVTAGIQIVMTIGMGILEALPNMITAGFDIIITIANAIITNLPHIFMTGLALIAEIVTGIVTALPDIFSAGWDIIKSLGSGLLDAATNILPGIWEGIKGGFNSLTGWLKGDSDTTSTKMRGDAESTSSGVSSSFNTLESNLLGSFSNISSNGVNDFSNFTTNTSAQMSSWSTSTSADVSSAKKNIISDTGEISVQGIKDFETMNSQVTSSAQDMANQSTQAFSGMGIDMNNETAKMAGTTEDEFRKMTDNVNNQMGRLEGVFHRAFGAIRVNIRKSIDSIKSTYDGGMSNLINSSSSAVTGITNIFQNLAVRMRVLGSQAGSGFRIGLGNQRGGIMATANSIANSVSSTIRKALAIRSPSRLLMELGSFAGEGLNVGLFGWIKEIERTSQQLAQAMTVEDYQVQTTLATSASIESSGVSSRLDNLSDEVRDVERAEPQFEVHNEIVGDEIYTTIKQKDARKENTSKYFKN